MRNHFHTIVTLLELVILPAVSCVKETARGNAFEANLSLDTPTVFDGDEFVFTLKSNREQVKVISFDFPLSPDLLPVGESLSLREGQWVLREKVSVPVSQRGKLSLSVQDPTTGLVKEFSLSYIAYASTGLSLLIDNEAVSSKYLTSGLPAVVGGDDFSFTLRSKSPRLILKDFSCELDTKEALSIGQEFLFNDNLCRVSIPEVSASDNFSPELLSLNVLDPDTGKDTVLTARYVTVEAFSPAASLVDPHLIEGKTAKLRLTANRPSFQLRSYTAPSWFTLKSYNADDPDVNLDIDGQCFLETKPLNIDGSGDGEIHLELFDNEYTKRSVFINIPYTASTKSDPRDVIVSKSDIKICNGETCLITVSTTTENSTNRFIAKVLSGGGSIAGIYVQPADSYETPEELENTAFGSTCTVTDGKLYIRGKDKWGPVTIRIESEGHPRIYKDIKVYTRRDVALRLKGTFVNYVTYWPDSIDDAFSNLGSGSECVGWFGHPASLSAELVAYENRSSKKITDLSKEEVSTWVKCFSLNDGSKSPFQVTYIVSVGAPVTSRFYYSSYWGYDDPRTRLLDGREIDRTVYATHPDSLNEPFTSNSVNGNEITLGGLSSFLKGLNCYADYQHAYGLFVMFRETRHSTDHMGFGTFDIALSKVTYDHDKYNLKWVMDMCEVPGEYGEAAPWWSGIGGTRPWIKAYKE